MELTEEDAFDLIPVILLDDACHAQHHFSRPHLHPLNILSGAYFWHTLLLCLMENVADESSEEKPLAINIPEEAKPKKPKPLNLVGLALTMVAHFVCALFTGFIIYTAQPGSSKLCTTLSCRPACNGFANASCICHTHLRFCEQFYNIASLSDVFLFFQHCFHGILHWWFYL